MTLAINTAAVALAPAIVLASGLAAHIGQTHDRTRPMLQKRQKVLASAVHTWPKADITRKPGVKAVSF